MIVGIKIHDGLITFPVRVSTHFRGKRKHRREPVAGFDLCHQTLAGRPEPASGFGGAYRLCRLAE